MARVSASVKQLRGTARADRTPKLSARERLTQASDPPQSLSDYARQEWAQLMPALVELGTACACDLRALELLCECLSTERELREVLRREGLTIPGADGNQKTHPAAKLLETSRSQAHRLLADFGLTPRGRQGVDVPPPRSPATNYFDL
jgi:P27 family predicted phage terminase small subunit